MARGRQQRAVGVLDRDAHRQGPCRSLDFASKSPRALGRTPPVLAFPHRLLSLPARLSGRVQATGDSFMRKWDSQDGKRPCQGSFHRLGAATVGCTEVLCRQVGVACECEVLVAF